MFNRAELTLITIILFLIFPISNQAQEINKDAITVYLDCQTSCDRDFLKNEIKFVNFVRDKEQAAVHILATSLSAASGGHEYTLTFYGINGFTGINDTLSFITRESDTDDMVRQEMVRIMKLGLIKYVNNSPLADKIKISYTKPTEDVKVIDKWKNWVFSLGIDSWLQGQKSFNETNIWGEIEARKITEKLKIELELWGDYSETNYYWDAEYSDTSDIGYQYDLKGSEIDTAERIDTSFVPGTGSNYIRIIDTSNIVDTTFSVEIKYPIYNRSRGFAGSITPSLTDHMSLQFSWNFYSSTYSNKRFLGYLATALEYNIYPYSESTRKQLTLSYQLVGAYADYFERTLYGKKHEYLLKQAFTSSMDINQPWGSANLSFTASNYFHDFDFYRLQLYGGVSIRLFEGFSFNIDGNVSKIHDQINIPMGKLDEMEIIARQRELATSYSYWLSFGISYSFGSIYTNVVNPRFEH